MTIQACCICSSLLDTYDATTEKAIIPDRHLGCCDRIICARCTNNNPRYKTYCPYCQISTEPSPLPQGLKDPPAYDAIPDRKEDLSEKHTQDDVEEKEEDEDELPAYSSLAPQTLSTTTTSEKSALPLDDSDPALDVLHFLRPEDSLHSLSLAYNVPPSALRRTNNVFADHLLQGRKTVLIPGTHYRGGESLSPSPLEGEEEEMRRNKVRRWMVGCKVSE